MFTLELQWKEFNISLLKVQEWLEANVNITTPFAGLSANSCLQIHFESEPTSDEKIAINTYWNLLNENSLEVESYQSAEELAALTLAKRDSAKAKLSTLGLTADEIKAILG